MLSSTDYNQRPQQNQLLANQHFVSGRGSDGPLNRSFSGQNNSQNNQFLMQMLQIIIQLVQQLLTQMQSQKAAQEQPSSNVQSDRANPQSGANHGSTGIRGAKEECGATTVAQNNQLTIGDNEAQAGLSVANRPYNTTAQAPQQVQTPQQEVDGAKGSVQSQGVSSKPGGSGSQGAKGTQPETGSQRTPEFRSFDGTGNNLQTPELGSTDEKFQRVLKSDPSRGPDSASGGELPNARDISNAVSDQTGSTQSSKGASDMFWLWGQFLDHDITASAESHGETANIAVPKGDPQFDPFGTGKQEMKFTRSESIKGADGQNHQLNEITAFIDGSNVYGSDKETADSLRSFDGGKLILADRMMPENERGHFMAGDKRANENPGLTSMHTLWAREHNRIAGELAQKNPGWDDERLYQEARNINAAQMQAVTYNEFLPMLLGENAIPNYEGYDPDTNPQMANAFSSAAFRFGHSMVSPTLLRLDEAGNEIPEGNLGLRDAFFQPKWVKEAGIAPILRGASAQTAQEVDTMVIDDLRNVLFGRPGSGGMDLVALNIQRGRDHELPGYNDAREQLGLPRIESFDDPIWQDGVGAKLAEVYDSPDDVDLWIAGLAEKPVGDAMMGETNTKILTAQFAALRDGDRFWYENQFSGDALAQINNTSLADIIKRNSDVQNIQDNVMVASNAHLA